MRAWLTIMAFVFVLAASPTLVLGQGSTGGVIGKQGKSVSGDEAQPPKLRAAPRDQRQKSSAPSSSSNRVFSNPTKSGKPIDNCLTYAANCGEPSASVYCRSKGFARAVDWQIANAPTTFVQGSGQTCVSSLFPCGGFTRVVCE